MLLIAIEYLLVHTLFETIRENDKKRNSFFTEWKPLSQDYILSIMKLTN